MTRSLVLFSIVAMVSLFVGATARADHRRDWHDEIGGHAIALSDHARELYEEVRSHFRGEPLAARALTEVLAVYRSSRRIAGYADAHSSPFLLEREVTRMEDAFHALEGTLQSMSRLHGTHRHIRELTRCIDDLVHDIHADIHELSDGRYSGRPGIYGAPVAPASGRVDLGPSDLYFGGGGVRVRLGR